MQHSLNRLVRRPHKVVHCRLLEECWKLAVVFIKALHNNLVNRFPDHRFVNPFDAPLLPEDNLMRLGICSQGFPDDPDLEGVGVWHFLAVVMYLEELDLGV